MFLFRAAVKAEGAEAQIVLDRHRREQRALFRNKAHALGDHFLDRRRGFDLAVETDFAARRQDAHQRRKQGRLASTIGADDGDDLTLANCQIGIRQGFNLAVGHAQVLDDQ